MRYPCKSMFYPCKSLFTLANVIYIDICFIFASCSLSLAA